MKPFVVTDENVLNAYGYRVLTDGISMKQFKRNPIMLYMHQRATYNAKGNEVIGNWKEITKKDGKILMTPNFDDKEKFANEIKGKVDRGFIKMSSIGIKIIETSTDPKYMIKGQTRPTVIKCKLVEVSVVDVGANDNAMQLYAKDGEVVTLSDALPVINPTKSEDTKPINIMKELQLVAQALGLKVDADISAILTAIADAKQETLAATNDLTALKAKVDASLKAESSKLITALKDGKLITEDQVPTYEALFTGNHDSAKTVVEGMLATLSKKSDTNTGDKLDQFITSLGANGKEAAANLSFEKLSKEDPTKLAEIEEKNPELFAKLLDEYSA